MRIVEGATETQAATHLMDFHVDGSFPTLSSPPVAQEKLWVFPDPMSNVWIIVDIFLTYDPNDYVEPDGFERQLFIKINAFVQNSQTINLTGNLAAALTAAGGTPNSSLMTTLKNTGAVLSFAGSSGKSIATSYSSAKNLGTNIIDQVTQGKFAFLPDNLEQALSNFGTGLLNGDAVIPAALKGITQAIGGVNLVQRLFFSKSTASVQYLKRTLEMNGGIFDETSTAGWLIPYSGSTRSTVPLYAYQHPNPAYRKLGLFHLARQPARISKIVSYQTIDTDAMMEPLSCLVQMNPTSLSHTTDETYSLSMPRNTWPYGTTTTLMHDGQNAYLSFRDPANPSDLNRNVDLAFVIARWDAGSSFLYSAATIPNKSPCLEGNYGSFPVSLAQFPDEYALGASNRLQLNDRVVVYDSKDNSIFGKVYSKYEATLGVEAVVGGLFSPYISLRDRAKVMDRMAVSKNLYSLGMQNASTNTIPRNIEDIQSISIPDNVILGQSYVKQNPLWNYPSITVESGQCYYANLKVFPQQAKPLCSITGSRNTLQLAPGFYGSIIVRGNARLELGSGVYYISSLNMESGSDLVVDQTNGTTKVLITSYLSWRGDPTDVDPARLIMVYLNEGAVYLESPFNGTFIAPLAKVVLGQRTFSWYFGRFFARILEVHQNSRIVRVPFEQE
jgi:hypothetical protein